MKSFFRYALLALLLLSQVNGYGQTGIQFAHGSFTEVLARAQKEGKYVFLDAYTDWCGPCKWMAANTFTDAKVGELYNAKFINYKLDMEKGEGPAVAEKYEVNAYPSLLFIDGNGALVEKAIGARGVEEFLALGEKMVGDGFVTLPQLHARFEKGDHDRDFLYTYILRLYESGLSTEAPLAIYKQGMQGEALLEKNNWDIFEKMFWRTDSDQFKYVTANYGAFVKAYGEDIVRDKIVNAYLRSGINASRNGDEAAFGSVIEGMKGSGLPGMDLQVQRLYAIKYHQAQDYPALVEAVNVLVSKYDFKDPMELNNFSWAVYGGTEDKKLLKSALAWADRAIAVEADYAVMDTKAMLLAKLGRKKEAIAAAEAAIETGKAAGEDVSATQEALDSWK